MKYHCEDEFDLNEIYRKLTSPLKVETVRACDFFQPITWEEFKLKLEIAIRNRSKTTHREPTYHD